MFKNTNFSEILSMQLNQTDMGIYVSLEADIEESFFNQESMVNFTLQDRR